MTRADAFELGRLDAHDQAALVRSGVLRPVDLAAAAITRIKALDGQINAVSHRAFDQARAAAKAYGRTPGGPAMAGVPYLVKEGLDYPGMPTRFGSRLHADAPPARTAFPFSQRLDAAGLVAVGKSAAPEFALLPTTEPVLYGPTRNPWNLDRSAGGSSGGAAAAVAAGMVPVAHASDGGGSIRIPAACCGVFGLKPSRHAHVRARGHHVVEDLLVSDTLLTRSVRDAHWATVVTRDGDGLPAGRRDPGRLRIALSLTNLLGAPPHPEVAQAVQQAARLCETLGHRVEVVPVPIDGPGIARAFEVLWGYLTAEVVDRARGGEHLLEPWTLDLADWARRLEPRDLEAALEAAAWEGVRFAEFTHRFDVVLSPVVTDPPPALGVLGPLRPFEDLKPAMFGYVAYTQLHNLIGAPRCRFRSTGPATARRSAACSPPPGAGMRCCCSWPISWKRLSPGPTDGRRIPSARERFLMSIDPMAALDLPGLNTQSAPTPALVLDRDRLTRNLARMRAHLAHWPQVTLRPHLKTSKSLAVAALASPDQGPITVSTLREAEVFAGQGFSDITYAVGVSPDKLPRAAQLNRQGARVSVILDSEDMAEAVARFVGEAGVAIPTLIELDTDGHRGGVRPDDAAVGRIGRILDRAGVLAGVLTHAGGSYGARSEAELIAFAEQERSGAVAAAETLRALGLPCPTVSIGSTPTVLFTRDLSGVTEVRAGVFMFQDLVMAGIGVCAIDDIALSVLTTVIGHQLDRGRLIIDAGWMALSRDRGTASQPVDQGYGLVADADGRPIDDLIVSATNQEHGVVARRSGEALDPARFPVGARLRVFPNHACATAAQHGRYLVLDGRDVSAIWPRFGQW
ncbi:amidase family protein [Phenylobacterium aquaticum]|uniref:amidase family protein n=1 Tax=Phenylobacterium aquaticum TaxID=1763816 RepID=UPI001F5DE9D8|nr:amidase family protein [Phenylobacterium aquaticum]MCI3131181.1 amidase family protein [Phenylobacterium aquaticum]